MLFFEALLLQQGHQTGLIPQGILLPLKVTGDTQHLFPSLCRIKCCFKHPGCCNCVACSWSPVSGWRACGQESHLCRRPCCLLALQSRSTDRQSWACAYVLCELRASCFVLKGINKWFFEANGLFCLYIYAIILLQFCNSLLDVRLALYMLTLMSCRIQTPCPAHTLFPLAFPLLLSIIFLFLACCLPAVMGVCPFAYWESGSKSYVCFFFFLHSGTAVLISLKQNERPINGENPEGKYITVDLMSRYGTHSSFYRDHLKTVIHCIF